MKTENDVTARPAIQEVHPESPTAPAPQEETPSRRKLIERYGKYAIVAAPLLMFASKAHAIHSKP